MELQLMATSLSTKTLVKSGRNPTTTSNIHCFSGPRLLTGQALFSLWEWLHLWQVWVCLERIRQVRLLFNLSINQSTHPLTPLYNLPLSFPLPLSVIMTGSYNNFFRMFDRNTKRDVTLEASRENSKPRAILKPRKVNRLSRTQVIPSVQREMDWVL